jgi:hypothetical protein
MAGRVPMPPWFIASSRSVIAGLTRLTSCSPASVSAPERVVRLIAVRPVVPPVPASNVSAPGATAQRARSRTKTSLVSDGDESSQSGQARAPDVFAASRRMTRTNSAYVHLRFPRVCQNRLDGRNLAVSAHPWTRIGDSTSRRSRSRACGVQVRKYRLTTRGTRHGGYVQRVQATYPIFH